MAGLALLVGTAALATGCGSDDSSKAADSDKATDTSAEGAAGSGERLHFAMVTHSDDGVFWAVVKKASEQAGKDLGVDITWSPSNNDPEKQAQLIDAAVSEKVDGLAVSVPNVDAIKGPLAKAKAAGIPIITLNSGVNEYESLGAITHVGQDESIAGEAAGQKLKAAGVKKVLCVIQEQNNIGLQQRCDGVKKGFGGPVTNLQVKGTSDLATTGTEIKSKLQSDPSFDGVMSLGPDIAGVAKTAIKDAGSNAKLATFDLSGDIIKDIESGAVLFAVDQQQYLQGYLPVVFLKLFHDNANTVGGGQPVLTGPGFVDKTNAATVAKLAEAGTR